MAALWVFVMQPPNVYPFMDSIVTSFLYNPVVEAIAHVPMLKLYNWVTTCNSCQPSRVHSSQTYREHEHRDLPRISLLDHAPTARPNVRTAVCNEKVPGKEDMWLPQRTLRKTCENALWCYISTDDGYVPFHRTLLFQRFEECVSWLPAFYHQMQRFPLPRARTQIAAQSLNVLVLLNEGCFQKDFVQWRFFPHVSCCTGSLLSALEVYLIVHRLVGGSSKGHSCWSQWGLRLTWQDGTHDTYKDLGAQHRPTDFKRRLKRQHDRQSEVRMMSESMKLTSYMIYMFLTLWLDRELRSLSWSTWRTAPSLRRHVVHAFTVPCIWELQTLLPVHYRSNRSSCRHWPAVHGEA